MSDTIESTQHEERLFYPPESFVHHAHVKSLDQYQEAYKRSIEEPEVFWDEVAQQFTWFRPYDK